MGEQISKTGEVLAAIRALLLESGGRFDDPYTNDAERIADIAGLLGLCIERDEYGVLKRVVETP